jgi:uncharacterized SAM-binding protein YcdF (DUF218 family)
MCGLLLIGILVSLIQIARSGPRQKLWLSLGLGTLASLWIVSSPFVGNSLLRLREKYYAPLQQFPEDCETIVVLAGSMLSNTLGRPIDKLGESTLRRCLEAHRLYKRYGQPTIIVSGGPVPDGQRTKIISVAMTAFLVELGVDRRHITEETESTNTRESSIATARILSELGEAHVTLVTDAAHMARAAKCFERRGISVTPAPCNFQASWPPESWRWFVPSYTGLLKTQYALHEYLGTVWYWMIDQDSSDQSKLRPSIDLRRSKKSANSENSWSLSEMTVVTSEGVP